MTGVQTCALPIFILIGNPDEIHALAKQWGLEHIDKATLIDPENQATVEVNINGETYSGKLSKN